MNYQIQIQQSFENLFNVYYSQINFIKLCGVTLNTTLYVILDVEIWNHQISIEDILMTFYFLKCYPINGWERFGITDKTYHKKIWGVINLLHDYLHEVFVDSWSEQDETQIPLPRTYQCIDTTEFSIRRPAPNIQRFFYSGYAKQHTIKYQISCNVSNGIITHASGPYFGPMNDNEVFRRSQIVEEFPRHIRWLGDKQYPEGIREHTIAPYRRKNRPMTIAEWALNVTIHRNRVIIENAIGRLKRFDCMKELWRHQLNYHETVFFVCLNLANLDIHERPLRHYNRVH